MTNTLRSAITKIRNATIIKKTDVEIPKTKITHALANILYQEGFIENVNRLLEDTDTRPTLNIQLKYSGIHRESVITSLRCISRPSTRIYMSYKKIPKLIGKFGVIILSTPKGLITDHSARIQKLGGEILCSVWS